MLLLTTWTSYFYFSIQFQSNFIVDEWENAKDDDFDDISKSSEDIDDATSDLISEEESDKSSIDNDDPNANEIITDKSDSESDVDIPLSSLLLNDDDSIPVDHFKLLSDAHGLMKKSRLLIKFIRNHHVVSEYVNKLKFSNNNGQTTGWLVLDMIIRWNSSFLLLDRLIDHKDVLKRKKVDLRN